MLPTIGACVEGALVALLAGDPLAFSTMLRSPTNRAAHCNARRRASVTALMALAVSVAALAAGCGSSPSPEEKWAGAVCTDITTWKDAVTQAADSASTSLQSPGLGTVSELQADLQSAEDATRHLVKNLQSLQPLNTQQGKRATAQLDALTAQIQGAVLKARTAVAGITPGAGIIQAASQLLALAPSLATLTSTASSTLTSIKSGAGALSKGFDDADACRPYR